MSTIADEVAALRGTKPATFKDLLTHPAFSKLLAAQTISSLGDWVGFVAVAALVNRLGGAVGAYAVAGVMVARMLPAILFGPIAGALADRMDRKRMMMTADIARGLLYATMPFLGKLYLIFLVSFVIECFSLLWTPARDASLPNLVPRRQLANANSLGLVTTYGTLPLGGLIFAFLAVVFFFAAARAARAAAFAARASASASGSPGLVTWSSRSSSAPQFQQRKLLGRRTRSEPHSGHGRSGSGGLFTAKSHSGYRSQPYMMPNRVRRSTISPWVHWGQVTPVDFGGSFLMYRQSGYPEHPMKGP